MDVRQQGVERAPANLLVAVSGVGVQLGAGLQAHADALGSAFSQRLQQCRHNLYRRQLRLQYGGRQNRVTVSAGRFGAAIPGDSVVESVLTSGLANFLNLYNVALIGRLILTWFPNPPEAIVGPLATVCDPYLSLFRGIIPPIGGTIDLSPILAFITLDLFTNAAAALPCEMGPDGQRKQRQAVHRALNPTMAMQAWHKRMASRAQRKEAASQQ